MVGADRDRHLRRRRPADRRRNRDRQRQRRRRSGAAHLGPRTRLRRHPLGGARGDRLRDPRRAALLPLPRRRLAQRPGATAAGRAGDHRPAVLRRLRRAQRGLDQRSRRPVHRRRSALDADAGRSEEGMRLRPQERRHRKLRSKVGRGGQDAAAGLRRHEDRRRRSRKRAQGREPARRLGRLRAGRPHRPRRRPLLQLPVGDADRPALALLGLAGDGARRRRPAPPGPVHDDLLHLLRPAADRQTAAAAGRRPGRRARRSPGPARARKRPPKWNRRTAT